MDEPSWDSAGVEKYVKHKEVRRCITETKRTLDALMERTIQIMCDPSASESQLAELHVSVDILKSHAASILKQFEK